MKIGDYRYVYQGDVYRVVIVGDVVALPDEHWSGANYGSGISEEWLYHSGGFPKFKGKAQRRIFAYMVRRALADHNGYQLERTAWPGEGGPPPRQARGRAEW